MTDKALKKITSKQCYICKKRISPKERGSNCINCSMKKVIKNCKEMHQKKGPAWEKWKQGMRVFVESELK